MAATLPGLTQALGLKIEQSGTPMKNMRNLTARQYLFLIGGVFLVCFGMYHLLRYTFGYPIAFGIPSSAFYGTGSRVASAYGIIAILGGMLFRRVYDKLPASGAEA